MKKSNVVCSSCGDWLIGGSEIEEKEICYDCLLEEQKEMMNNLNENEISHVQGFSTLDQTQKELLVSVYKKHLLAMGTVTRNEYIPEKIIKVKHDKNENTVNIYFKDNWWHYQKDHTWY